MAGQDAKQQAKWESAGRESEGLESAGREAAGGDGGDGASAGGLRPDQHDPLVPLAEAARRLGVSPRTLFNWIHAGKVDGEYRTFVGRKRHWYVRASVVRHLEGTVAVRAAAASPRRRHPGQAEDAFGVALDFFGAGGAEQGRARADE